MKQFSNWEAREERKFHADLLQEQRGVLFVGDSYEPPPPDSTSGVLQISPEQTLRGSKTPRHKRGAPGARRQDKKDILLPLPSSMKGAGGPEQQLHRSVSRTVSKGKEPMVIEEPPDAGEGPSLRRANSAPPELPVDGKADTRSPVATDGDSCIFNHIFVFLRPLDALKVESGLERRSDDVCGTITPPVPCRRGADGG